MKSDIGARLLDGLGRFVLGHRLLLLTGVLLLTVFFAFFVPSLELESDMSTWHDEDDELFTTLELMMDNFDVSNHIVVAYDTPDPFSHSELEYLSNLTSHIVTQVDHIAGVSSLVTLEEPVWLPNGTIAMVPFFSNYSLNETQRTIIHEKLVSNPLAWGVLVSSDLDTLAVILELEDIQNKSNPLATETEIVAGLRDFIEKETDRTSRDFHISGTIIQRIDVESMMWSDMQLFLPLAVLINAVALFILFRRLSRVVLPLITVLFALIWTLGIKGMADSPISPVSTTLFALIVVIGLADSIHFISHYRQELERTGDKKNALMRTYSRAGVACLFTSLTTSAGFGSLLLSPLLILRNLGLYSAIGIMSAFVLTMVVIPLGLMMERRKKGMVETYLSNRSELNTTTTARRFVRDRVLGQVGRINLRHGKWVAGAGVLLVFGACIGIPMIEVEGSLLNYLWEDAPVVEDANYVDANLNGISDIEIILTADPGSFGTVENLTLLETFQREAENWPNVASTLSVADHVKLMRLAQAKGNASYNRLPEYDSESRNLIAVLLEGEGSFNVRGHVTPDLEMSLVIIKTHSMSEGQRGVLIERVEDYWSNVFSSPGSGRGSGVSFAVTGFDKIIHQTTLDIVTTQIVSLALSFAIILVMMMLLFGIRGGLISIIPNIFPIVLLFGTMGFFGFTLNIASATIAAMAIGLVVDDTVHYFYHYKMEYMACNLKRLAMKRAMKEVGEALCYTTLILVLGYLIFLFSQTKILWDFAILSSIAIISALFSDLFLGAVALIRLSPFKKS